MLQATAAKFPRSIHSNDGVNPNERAFATVKPGYYPPGESDADCS